MFFFDLETSSGFIKQASKNCAPDRERARIGRPKYNKGPDLSGTYIK